MEVWLLESSYCGEVFSEIFLHVRNTDLWFTNTSFSGENIENTQFYGNVWEDDTVLFTKLGNL